MDRCPVLSVNDVRIDELRRLLARYGLSLIRQADGTKITGSYWGEPEAGIVASTVYVRGDTPVHSALHEAGHIICMDAQRRRALDRNAGGDDLEEAAVCYLQIVLADCIESVGSARLMQDMDRWGYSFRLGSTRRWFADDAGDARGWLIGHGILDAVGRLTYACRDAH